jgi:protein disulfide-isomerase A1
MEPLLIIPAREKLMESLATWSSESPQTQRVPFPTDLFSFHFSRQALPSVSEVTVANHDEFKTSDKFVVIAYVSSTTEAPVPEFSATADKHRDEYLFGLTTDSEVIAAANVKTPTIVVYRTFDEPATEYPYPIRDADAGEIEGWIKDLAVPVIDEVNGENYAVYAQSAKPLAYLFLDPTGAQHESHIAAIKPLAAKHKGKINFVWIDALKFADHAKALNLVEPTWPSFVIQDLILQLKYPFDQSAEVTPEAVSDFVDLYVAGELEPQLKSEAIPESQDESVFHLVGKQFDEVVFDDSKDVFIEFYATWSALLAYPFPALLTRSVSCPQGAVTASA